MEMQLGAVGVERFLSGIHTLPWDEAAADEFAKARSDIERGGTPIGIMDTMIAGDAKATPGGPGHEQSQAFSSRQGIGG